MHVPRSYHEFIKPHCSHHNDGRHSVPTHHHADSPRSSPTRIRLLAGVVAALFVVGVPVAGFTITPAQAQASISVQFRTALQDHGRWQRHSRWGEVWIPASVQRDWRPYTRGHWVYTDDWGWYWVEDDAEASWGWVTNHYGRWVYDEELEWCWVPGEEWGPAWVQWRRSDNVVGWAALPPDDVVVEYRESPRFWVFVRARDFVSPRVASVIVSEREYPVFFRETVLVNRTVVVRDHGPRFAVNPGIPAAFIAARVGRPLRTFEVQPRVFAGTAQIRNSVVVREQDLRSSQTFRSQTTIRETRSEIRPSQRVEPPRALGANEQGRLGDNPPRAARGEQGGTQGRGPGDQQGVDRGDRGPDGRGRGEPKQKGIDRGDRGGPDQRFGTEGRGEPKQKQLPGTEGRGEPKQKQKQLPGTEGRGEPKQKQLPGTEGRGEPKQKQLPGTEGRGEPKQKQLPGTEGRGEPKQKQLPGTQGRGPGEQKQLPSTEGRGRGEPKQPPSTDGRGRSEPKQQLNLNEGRGRSEPQRQQMNTPPRQQMNTEGRGRSEPRPPSTDGRGGGGPQPGAAGRGGGEIRQAPAPRTEGRGGGGGQQQPAGRGGQPKQPGER
jgi:Family of unknown function (DUF6600)